MSASLATAILQTASVAYVLTDNNLVITETGGAERLLPASSPALVGASLLDVFPALRSRSEQIATIREHGRGELHWEQRASSTTLAGTLRPLSPTGEIILVTLGRAPAPRPARRRRSLPQPRTASRRMVEGAKVVPLLLATTMHELRTPLTVVTGYLSLLLDEACGPLTEAQAESLEAMARNVGQIQQLSADLLDTARIGSGQLVLRPSAVDVRRVIGRVIDDYRPQLTARGQRVSLDAPADLPYVWCDELRATQILMNLIGNASKYSPDGGRITVSVRGDTGARFIEIAVADSGIGITPSDQQHVFSPFYRATNTRHNAASGTGLGLFVTRALVEAHGGAIWLKSAPHIGSTFYLTLPQTARIALQACDA